MRKRNSIILLLIAVLFSACATLQKKVEVVQAEPEPVQEVPELSEKDQTEFEYLFIEGLKQKKLGNPQNAISIFSKCLEIDPNSAAAMFELANVQLANGDQMSASLLLEKAISINSENKWYKILLARIYQQQKQYEKAANLYGQLSEEHSEESESLEYLYMKAGMLSSAEKYDEAITAFDLLETKLGFNEQVLLAKQQVYIQSGQDEKAVEEINRLIKYNPKETRYYGLMADMYMDLGDSIKSLEYYNKVLEIEPDNGFVHFSLANYYQKMKDYDKAFEHTQEGFKNIGLDLDTKLQMFLLLTSNQEKSGLTEKQITILLGLLRANYPEDYRVQSLYADFLLRKGQLEEARTQIRMVLNADKSDYTIWERLLLVNNDLQDFDALYTDSKKAIELFPNQPMLYALNAVACLQKELYTETIDILKEGEPYVTKENPIKVQFEIYKAEANYKLGNQKEAFDAFDEVIKLDPENYMVLNNYAYYLSVIGKNLEKAARMSGKAVQANPNNSTYLDTYAWVLFMQKDYNLAKFYMESAINNGGDQNAVILEHYGDILFKLDRKDEAMKYWKKAQEAGEASDLLEEKITKGYYIEKLD